MLKEEEIIVQTARVSKKIGGGKLAFYPYMENELVAEFKQMRARGPRAKHWWFKTPANQPCSEKYPNADVKFSNVWFDAFKKRHGISYRAHTNNH